MSVLRLAILLALLLPANAVAAERVTDSTPLRLDGIGPIRIGMTLREAAKASGMKFTDPKAYGATDDPKSCTYVSFRNGPADVNFMLINGEIARMDINDKATNATVEGVRIGTRERDIRKLHPGAKIKVAPSFYSGESEHEITVAVPGHPKYRYFFGTDRKKVIGMRIGLKSAVEYVEGCL